MSALPAFSYCTLGGAWEQGYCDPVLLNAHPPSFIHTYECTLLAMHVSTSGNLSLHVPYACPHTVTHIHVGIKPGSLSREAESSLWNGAKTKNWEACPLFVVTLQLQNTVILLCAMSAQYKHAFIAFPGNKYYPVILYSTCYGLPNGTWPIYHLKLTWLSLFTKSVILLK